MSDTTEKDKLEAEFRVKVEYNLDQIDTTVFDFISVIMSQHRLIGELRYEVEQRRRQMLNLESRLFTLEGKQPKKRKSRFD